LRSKFGFGKIRGKQFGSLNQGVYKGKFRAKIFYSSNQNT